MYMLRGCQGALCHEYDHIVPFSKGGKTEISNCQILQTGVNRFKSDKQPTMDEMRAYSRVLRMDAQQMDLMEYACYGDYGEVAKAKAEKKAQRSHSK